MRKTAKTLTDEKFTTLGISLTDLDLKTKNTFTSVTRYFMTSNDDTSGISDNNAFTEYSKSRGKRFHSNVKWPEYLAYAF